MARFDPPKPIEPSTKTNILDTSLEPSGSYFPVRRTRDLFNRALNVFIDDEESLKQKGWSLHPSVECLPLGGYWISKRGKIYRIPSTHVDSINNLPELVISVFNQTSSRSSGSRLQGSDNIREAFMVESGWVRFRIHPLRSHENETGQLIDMTTSPTPTDSQRRIIAQLHQLKNTSVHDYELDPSGRVKIAHSEMTPYRLVKAAAEAASVTEPGIDLHDPRVERLARDPKIARLLRTGD